MALSDRLLEDPFFLPGWGERDGQVSACRPWATGWMMPRLLEEKWTEARDSHLLNIQEDDTKLEISLDTAGYKPDELKVQVKDGELSVEGRHEEKSEAGRVMVSRQFQRSYVLPQGARREAVMSNLSQDGVMVVTVPKEKKIEEVKGPAEQIQVEHVKNVGEMNRKSEEREDLRRRNSVGRVGAVRKTSLNQEMGVRPREEVHVPMTLRDPFLEDPFFKNTLSSLESSRGDFFKKARDEFEESMKQIEQTMTGMMSDTTCQDRVTSSDWITPMANDRLLDSRMNLKDNCVIKYLDDDTKLEVHLDTADYKPGELSVEVNKGVVRVEGRHEEKSQAGQVMVSKQFSRQYGLPGGTRPEEVTSSLSREGVLVVTVPKHVLHQVAGGRAVPIAIK